MARPELGVKRICPTTGKKFYDLNRDPIVSPYTGEVLQRAMFEPARRGSAAAKPAAAATDEDAELETGDAELVSLEEADGEEASPAKGAAIEDDVEVEVEDTGDDDDDTFLEEDEDEGDDDVADLIGDAADDDDDT
ncbi:TIGR02300 family protein [Phreatobacter sp.]|uniref:TIGR02300 family protein n=1 Tax=Phreatobacter sp. TaxID=1966341 RepID=UPI003F7099E3